MGLKRTVAATLLPVEIDEAKSHAVVQVETDDELIESMLQAAVQLVEERLHRALMTQTWQLTMDDFPAGDRIVLPRPPLQSIGSIQYVDTAGATQTFDGSNYVVDTVSEPGRLALTSTASWPSTDDRINAVTITFDAGWADPTQVPEPIKQAIKLLVGHWYENREAVLVGTISKQLELTVDALLAPYRNLELV